MTDEARPVSERSRGVALALGVVGGVFGLHRFYTGHKKTGVWMALTLGGVGMWYLYDVIMIAAGEFADADGRRVLRWEVEGDTPEALMDRDAPEVDDRLRRLETQVSELAERLDFAERMLAQRRGAEQLPRGS